MIKHLASILLTLIYVAREASIELFELAMGLFMLGFGVVLLAPAESIPPHAGNWLTPVTEPYAAYWLIALGLLKITIAGIHRPMGWARMAVAAIIFVTWFLFWWQLSRINPAGLDAACTFLLMVFQGFLLGRRSAIQARAKPNHVYQF